MRLVTWNINSLRLRLPTLAKVTRALIPDIICLQEIKVEDSLFPLKDIQNLGYKFAVYRGMKSYNGVAILSKLPLTEMNSQRWCDKDDCRHIAAKLANGIEIHNFYVPAGGDVPDPEENDKFAHKLAFIKEMAGWFKNKRAAKRILVGDLNIAPLDTDVWSHKQLLKIVSHTPLEIEGLENVMAAHNWVDAVRKIIPPEEPLYSWWSYRNRTWPGSNRGRRLDHIWVTPSLINKVNDAKIFAEARGWEKPSDHVPVMIDLEV